MSLTDEIKEALDNAPIIGLGGTIQANAKVWLRHLFQENQQYREALQGIVDYGASSIMGRFYANIARQALKKEGEPDVQS